VDPSRGTDPRARGAGTDPPDSNAGDDPREWSPETDPLIPYAYRPSDFQNKRLNTTRLYEAMEIERRPDLPLVGVVFRGRGGGLDRLLPILEPALEGLDLRFAVLADGDPADRAAKCSVSARYAGRVAVDRGFSRPMESLLLAGSELILIPSGEGEAPERRHDFRDGIVPVGFRDGIVTAAFRYGTVPVAGAGSGLVREFEPVTCKGTGFVLRSDDPREIAEALSRAVQVYQRPRTFKKLVFQIMRIGAARRRPRCEDAGAR
jgi:starch synthase